LKNSGTTADLAVIDEKKKGRCIILETEKKEKEYKQVDKTSS
jgi:hypothetical protein